MNTRYIKSILTLLMVWVVMPVMAQDYMTICLKNGEKRRIPLKNIIEIISSKKDEHGQIYNDYQFLHVTTKYNSYFYRIEDVDSISYRKVIESEVDANTASCYNTVFPILNNCVTIDDVERNLENIQNSNGIEKAWVSCNRLYVKVKDGETISFYINSVEDEDEDEEAEARSFIISPEKLLEIKKVNGTNNRNIQIAIANQTKNDGNPSFVKGQNRLEEIKKGFENLGFEPKEVDPTLNFFYSTMFDYDVIVLCTHGGYNSDERDVDGNPIHTFCTSNHIGISYQWITPEDGDKIVKQWKENARILLSNLSYGEYLLNNENVNWYIEWHQELRDLEFTWIAYIAIPESFFKYVSEGAFPDNSIMFAAVCHSVQGQPTLAQKLLEKNLGGYLGYNEETRTSVATKAARHFFNSMMSGKSMQASEDEIPNKYKVDFLTNAELHSYKDKNLFLFPTYTEAVDPANAESDFKSHQYVQVKGFTTTNDMNAITMGFVYGTDESLTSGTHVTNVEKNPLTTDKGNIVFNAKLTDLVPGTTYYYRAYTWDGVSYNYGDPCTFTINNTAPTSCPDNNHPHMIDLGLPSGTKWACCNVGASKPEDSGNCYAWGETQTKDVYNWNSYIHSDGSVDTCHDIGSDIAGTQYDAATTSWGAPWQMPSIEQQNELIDNCTSNWVTQDGVKGRKLFGPNGGCIFLPATGVYSKYSLIGNNSSGYYWSSTLYEPDPNISYEMNFNSSGMKTGGSNRYLGQFIRPVRSSGATSPSINVITLAATDVSGTSATLNGSIAVSNTNKSYEAGFFLSTTSSAPSSTDNTLNVTCGSSSPVGNFSASATGLSAGTKYNYRAYVLYDGKYYYGDTNSFTTSSSTSNTSCPDNNHPHMIDLGLPSGTKWACCNVGATKPEDYGNYYAWGETQPKEVYSWESYKFGYYNYDEDYSHLVNIGSDISGTQYDAATANWGAPWQMPSKEQYDELNGNCTSVWTTENGVNGRKFTGPNGISLFLPAAGFRWDYKLEGAGSYGNYWTSLLPESCPDSSWHLHFYSRTVSTNTVSYRRTGLSVRPVRK